MRPVTLTDLAAAARVLLALPEARRAAAMAALIVRAEAADRYRRRNGLGHPVYGNGTLLAAALAHPAAAPEAGARDYLACLALATEAVLRHPAAPVASPSGKFLPIDYLAGQIIPGGAPCPRSNPD